MKRITTVLTTFLLLTGYVKGQQQFSNSGFESWDTLGDYTQPTNWFSLNTLSQFGFDPSTTITADAHSGNYAVKLTSLNNGSFGDYAGVLCTGPILNSQLQPDFSNTKIAFIGRPVSFEFYYKAKPMPQDTCVIGIYFTKWNNTLQQSDTIGVGGASISDSTSHYTFKSVSIEYYTPLQPDSMILIASSSIDGFNPTAGSEIILDDFQLTYGVTGIAQLASPNFNVYPNPSNLSFELNFDRAFSGTVIFQDITGKQLQQQKVSGIRTLWDISTFNNGIYFLLIRDEAGSTRSQKIIIQH